MVKAENQSQENSNIEKIKPLKLQEVTTIRNKIKRLLKRVGAILGTAIVGGVVGGNTVQSGFRSISGYEPDWEEKLEKGELTILDKKEKEETIEEKGQTPEEVEEETNGILDKIKGTLSKGAEFSEEAIKKLIDAAVNKLMDKYKDAEKQMLEKYFAAMEEVDNMVFWGSFWASFAITMILTLGLIQLKKLVLGESDPEVQALEKQVLRIKDKINEMIEKQNAMMNMEFVPPKQVFEAAQEAKKLIEEFEDVSKEIDDLSEDGSNKIEASESDETPESDIKKQVKAFMRR